jgi:hypothetical protein
VPSIANAGPGWDPCGGLPKFTAQRKKKKERKKKEEEKKEKKKAGLSFWYTDVS